MTTSFQRVSLSTPLVGLIVEGESEIGAIPQLLRDSGARFLRPVKFNGQPTQCDDQQFRQFIQGRIVPHVRAMVLRNTSLIVVIVDREQQEQCPGAMAQDIRDTIVRTMMARYGYTGSPPISAVCADRTLENWLVADPRGILAHNNIVRDVSRAVGSNADGKDGQALLRRAYGPRQHYHKAMDAPQLASRVDAMRPDVRARSRSLDKLLRECGVAPLR